MSNWEKIPTPDLLRNVARHWRKTTYACPSCGQAVYRHTCSPGSYFTYIRCPTCPQNFLRQDKIRAYDLNGEKMLDEAARRFPAITEPESFNSPIL